MYDTCTTVFFLCDKQNKMGCGEASDCTYRVLMIGDTQVGKTSVLMRFAMDFFQHEYISTIGKKK